MNALNVMEDEEPNSADTKHFCQAVSPNDEPCYNPATFAARSAVDGSAIATARKRSGIHARCRPERKVAKRRAPASLVSKVNSLVHRQWLRRDSKATRVLFVSTASAAASFRSKCGSTRRPPECSPQRCPAAAPQLGQGTENNCLDVRSFILIRICCANTLP